MTGAFNAQQLAQLEAMEKACADVDTWISTLEALGLDMTERKTLNDFRRAACARCREVDQQAKDGKLS